MDIENEIREVLGKRIDLDAAFPGECHDLFLWWLYKIGGNPGDGHAPWPGWTIAVFDQFPTYRPNLASVFTKHYGVEGLKSGDVVFWKQGRNFYGSHVAIARGAASGGVIPVYSQNPNPVEAMNITTADVAGYLRPIRALAESAPQQLKGKHLMFNLYMTGATPTKTDTHVRIITDYGSFGVPNIQLVNLLLRRRNDTLVSVPTLDVRTIGNQMLDTEHDIINQFLRTCFQSALTGVPLDPAKFLKAINEGFAALGKNITITADSVDLDAADFASAFEKAAPRIVKAMAAAVAK